MILTASVKLNGKVKWQNEWNGTLDVLYKVIAIVCKAISLQRKAGKLSRKSDYRCTPYQNIPVTT